MRGKDTWISTRLGVAQILKVRVRQALVFICLHVPGCHFGYHVLSHSKPSTLKIWTKQHPFKASSWSRLETKLVALLPGACVRHEKRQAWGKGLAGMLHAIVTMSHLIELRIRFIGQSNKREGAGIWGDSLGAISHIKLSQGASNGWILPYPWSPLHPC